MEEYLNMKNNFIQNFYIIGIDFKEIIEYIESNEFIDISKEFSPKMISKFPQGIKNYNTIFDKTVLEHCFPNNLFIKKGKKYEKYTYHFEFELDNKVYKYLVKNSCLYSKIHFTCLRFYESVDSYIDLNNRINNIKNIDENCINDENASKSYEIYYIPKVIGFASLLPFPNELYKILKNIYDYFKYQNIKTKYIKSYPIEKILEQIIMSLPIPIMNDCEISLSFDTNSFYKDIFTYQKIDFSSYELRDYYMNKSYDLDIRELFLGNNEETILNIFKNIILENSILFFSESKQYLSIFFEFFLNIISPFKYVHPCIAILPSKYYGLISSQYKFFFGINQKFSENFFFNNEIDINKNILIISIIKNDKNEIKIMTEEFYFGEEDLKLITLNYNPEKNVENNKVDLLGSNNIFNIDLPIKFKKKLLTKLKSYINTVKIIEKNSINEYNYVFKNVIMNIFQKFFINLLSGYTRYLSKSPNHNYFGFNIRHKIKDKNNFMRYIKEIFDYDEFLLNVPKEYHLFYKTFFQTKLFFNFIREIIYPKNQIDSLKHKYFDFLTFLKKEKAKRKSEEFIEQYEKYKMPFAKNTNMNKIKIMISNNFTFNESERNMLNKEENKIKALSKYYQLISYNTDNNKNLLIKYFIFPKLLFDNKFFNIDYNTQFYLHYIDLPTDKSINQLNKFISESENEFLSKCCFVIYQNISDNSSSLFVLYYNDYIEFNWLLLSSCSLWYCKSNKELETRINKIFDLLDKLEYIEEQVLYFIFYSLYKYGSTSHFIRIFEIILRFIGYYSYSDLLLLYYKLNEEKKNLINDNNNNNINNQKRSFVYIKQYIEKEIDDKIKEEIIFYNEQICEKCGNIIRLNEQDISELINKKIDKNKNAPIFYCKNCNKINLGIKINCKISLINIRKKKEIFISNDEFSLMMPHVLYCKIKDYVINLKENEIDINQIFSNKNINILNFIFYFSLKSLPFDFLLPYENINDKEQFFFNYDYINKKEKKQFQNVSPNYNEKVILNISNNNN